MRLLLAIALLVTASLMLIIAAGDTQAQNDNIPRVVLTDEQGFYPLGLSLEYLEDPTGQLTLQEVTSPEHNDRFTPSETSAINFGYTPSVYWFRFEVNNQTAGTANWLLELGPPFLDFVDLYLIDAAGQIDHRQAGDQYPFEQRELDHRHFVFKLFLPANSTHTVYLRLQNVGRIALSPALWEPITFGTRQYRLMLAYGLYFGALLIMAAYHALLAILTRDRIYFYYALYITLVGLLLASLAGLDAQFLWPGWPYFLNISTNAFTLLSGIVLLIFSAKFLQVKSHNLKLFRAIQILGLIHLLLLVSKYKKGL